MRIRFTGRPYDPKTGLGGTAPTEWYDAGKCVQLHPGQIYEMPDVVAESFIAGGLAEAAPLEREQRA